MSVEIRRAADVQEGAGVDVQRLMPVEGCQSYDPFVLWDHFSIGLSAGLPDHPHRGFEIVTYLFSGALRHEDDLGNRSTVLAGGAQRVTAGRGISHSEMPQGGVVTRGIQLWINLPRRLKATAPAYQQVDADEFPVKQIAGGHVTTIVGEGSPLKLNTPVRYYEIRLDPGVTWRETVPEGFRGLVYTASGSAAVDGHDLDQGDACFLDNPGKIRVEAREECRLMYCVGRPHGEEIRQRGSSVD